MHRTLQSPTVPVSESKISGACKRARRVGASPTRITGRKLQQRRLRMWSQSPNCAKCGRLTAWPRGFELDHVVSLDAGGPDTEDNTQVLCSGEAGCHRKKTAEDMGHNLKGCDTSGLPADPNHHWR